MNYQEILLRLKKADSKQLEVLSIKRRLRELPFTERISIIAELEQAKYRSDNSDIDDVINDIIQEFKPLK